MEQLIFSKIDCLDCDYIKAPGAGLDLVTNGEIVSQLLELSHLAGADIGFWQGLVGVPPACFNLHQHQLFLVVSDQIDLAAA